MSNLYDVHVDASRRFDSAVPADIATAGQWADVIASDNVVLGTEFSFKADGVVLDRTAKLAKLEAGTLLELIEVTVPAPDEGSDDGGDIEFVEVEVEGALVPPEGSRDDVLGWVDEGREGWRQRAQAALAAEQSGKQRTTVVDALTKVLAAE